MMRSTRGLGLVAMVAAVTGVVACRQVVGITDSPPEDLTASLCGLPYGTSACASCVHANCCAESTACAADTAACSPYESCLGKCNGEPKCRSQCTIDNPVGTASDVSALSACLASNCETACGLPCGGIADLYSPPDAAVACQQCLTKSTCSQAKTCASSEACDAVSRGNLAISTADSAVVYGQLVCGSSAASGFVFTIGGPIYTSGKSPLVLDTDAALSSTAMSFASSCGTACATGNYWACVGHVSWPSPKATTCTIESQYTDDMGAPLAGATVQVCAAATDANCDRSLGHGTTDADGRISVTVPNMPDTAGHGLDGFQRVSSPTIVTFDQYWGFPLVEAQFPSVGGQAFTPVELQEIYGELSVMQDPTRGTLAVVVYDCRFNPAPGVPVTLSPTDPGTQGFSTTGAETWVTGPTGVLFVTNVLPGLTQITTTPPMLGPSSRVSATVHPGMVTEVLVWPTPVGQ